MTSSVAANLYRATWGALDPFELRLLLDERIGGPGQISPKPGKQPVLYIPQAGPSCRLELRFPKGAMTDVRPGKSFDCVEWGGIVAEVETKLLDGIPKVGRDIGFSHHRVEGSWHGKLSGVQILQMPDPPKLIWEYAQHPFILEFSIIQSEFWTVTNYRRRRTHRCLIFLLNLLVVGRIHLQVRQPEPAWVLDVTPERTESVFMPGGYMGHPGEIVAAELSPPAEQAIQEVEPAEYYARAGSVGPLQVPSNLDQTLAGYLSLPKRLRARFDRSLFWLDMSQRQWGLSMSASLAALVTAIEVLLDPGEKHTVDCDKCGKGVDHHWPSIGASFRDFFDIYAPGDDRRSSASKVYDSRSSILHGDDLMQLDQDLAHGWDPPWWSQRQLHDDMSGLTYLALRNWLAATIAS